MAEPTDSSLLDKIPALPPPDGFHSDFEHHRTREGLGTAVVGLTYALMLVFLALRVYTRAIITNHFGIDDYLSLAAGASITAFTGLTLSLFGNPLGPHQWDVPLSQFNASFLERTTSSLVLFSLSALLVKTTLLALYLRVFAPNTSARRMIWAGTTVIAIFYVTAIILNIRFCVPISMTTPVPDQDAWQKKLKASTCSQPVYNLNAAVGLFGIVSDLYVLIIPVSMVNKLKMPRDKKIGILGIFLFGLLAVALSILSTAFRFVQLDSYDFTWDSIPSYTLHAAELNIGLICSCMPVVFVIIKRMFKARPLSSVRRAPPTPHERTASHAYVYDLRGRDYDTDLEGTYYPTPPTPPTPTAVTSLKTLVRQSSRPTTARPTTSRAERSTYTELGSMESG
ncbi:hypothetical protein F4808DRAFT_295229 [Astrocystis sublimbata]|nr:hypothetical protein F4808DRAFT_295229 [Astrocystis sublimbata]